jgi:arylsulfatase A-like enzyme
VPAVRNYKLNIMTINNILCGVILAPGMLHAGATIANTNDTSRPNVVLIVSDDHRYDWMNHQGPAFMETPNLDQLSREGWSFPNAFCVAGVCSPARAALFTGKYMHQASAPDIVWQNNSFLYLHEMFPQTLHKQGYRTGYVGKFHLGNEELPTPGFDLWASFPFVGEFFDQTIWVNGEPVKTEGFTDDMISKLAVQTLEEWSGSDQPFLLVVGLKAPHIPFVYPDRMNRRYEDVVFPEPETYDLDYSESKPALSQNLINAKTWPHAIARYGSFQEWVRSYTRLATTIDESVGQIMQAVEKSGIADNTIFIYTSDHGYSLGELSLCEKHYAYEQVMRVPLIVRFPGHKNPGNPPSDMVTHMDIAPTLMDYCSGSIPDEMEGKSWRSLIEDGKSDSKPFREEVFFDFWHNERDILPPQQAVRTERYKYIHYEYQPYEELYDLVNDPIEKYNLIDDKQYRSIKNDLSKRLNRWKKRTGWTSRSQHHLDNVYVSKVLTMDEDLEIYQEASRLTPTELRRERELWTKLSRQPDGFDISRYIPEDGNPRILYVAIPVRNRGKFDPFISLRFAFPKVEKRTFVPFTSFFDGEQIYMNYAYKQFKNIPPIEEREEMLRIGFDLGYNPPLRPGDSVIVLRMVLDSRTPDVWDIYAVGALSALKWF